MAIRKNPDGRTATVTRTGVTGNAGDGRAVTQRRAPLAQSYPTSAKRLPKVEKPVARKR